MILPSGLSLDVTDDPQTNDIARLDDGLTDHAAGLGLTFGRAPLGLFLKDTQGTVTGGVLANCYPPHGSVLVKDVWLDKALRGSGLGRLLMSRLEDEVRARGCTLIHLDTFDFQARGFYEKLGYEVFGSVRYPKSGRDRFFLVKTLEP